MKRAPNTALIITWLVALVITAAIMAYPVDYYLHGHTYLEGTLEAKVEHAADVMSQEFIRKDPDLWQLQSDRIKGFLSRGQATDEFRRVFDVNGRTIATNGTRLESPLITRSYVLSDAGVGVGTMEISRSLRPLLMQTAWIAGVLLACGVVVFFLIWWFPIRAVSRAQNELAQYQKGLEALVQQRTNELQALNKELENRAATDSLTGIANRREFERILARDMNRAQRFSEPLSLLMFDLDHFKEVNDVHGHDAGDMALKTVTGIVKQGIRSIDVLARWGGEEFVILTPQTRLESAAQVADRLRIAIADYHFEKIGRMTASFGATVFRPGDDAASFLKRVDDAMYKAKHNGRNRIETLA